MTESRGLYYIDLNDDVAKNDPEGAKQDGKSGIGSFGGLFLANLMKKANLN